MDGNTKLVADVEKLLEDCQNKDFSDFESSYDTPKVYLVERLQKLIDNVKDGRYDN